MGWQLIPGEGKTNFCGTESPFFCLPIFLSKPLRPLPLCGFIPSAGLFLTALLTPPNGSPNALLAQNPS